MQSWAFSALSRLHSLRVLQMERLAHRQNRAPGSNLQAGSGANTRESSTTKPGPKCATTPGENSRAKAKANSLC